jgi:hypothetical protein
MLAASCSTFRCQWALSAALSVQHARLVSFTIMLTVLYLVTLLRRAIVGEVVGLGVEDEDRRRTWMADAEEAARRGSIETARAIYNATLAAFPGKPAVWRAAAALEKQHGSREALDELLKRAVSYCPQAEVLWLMAAKERWLAGGGFDMCYGFFSLHCILYIAFCM